MSAWLVAWKQEIDRPLEPPVFPQQDQHALAEHGVTILGSFALLDVNQHPGRIDVLHFQRDSFGDAQAGSIIPRTPGSLF